MYFGNIKQGWRIKVVVGYRRQGQIMGRNIQIILLTSFAKLVLSSNSHHHKLHNKMV